MCEQLHLLERSGQISHLEVHPVFRFSIDGAPLMMANGHQARFTPDFSYRENGKAIAIDVKGFIAPDFPLRAALFRHLFKGWELRIIK